MEGVAALLDDDAAMGESDDESDEFDELEEQRAAIAAERAQLDSEKFRLERQRFEFEHEKQQLDREKQQLAAARAKLKHERELLTAAQETLPPAQTNAIVAANLHQEHVKQHAVLLRVLDTRDFDLRDELMLREASVLATPPFFGWCKKDQPSLPESWEEPTFVHHEVFEEEEASDGQWDTLLVRAARLGRVKSVQLLLSLGADPNEMNGHRTKPLHAACFEGRVDAVRCLIKGGADPASFSMCDEHRCIGGANTALGAACLAFRGYEQEDLERLHQMLGDKMHELSFRVVRCLLEEFGVVADTFALQHLLSVPSSSCMGMGPETIRLLLSHGLNPDDVGTYFCDGGDSKTSCSLMHITDLVDFAYNWENGGGVVIPDHRELVQTHFLTACQSVYHQTPQRKNRGQRPCEYEILDLMLAEGADPSVRNSMQRNAVDFAWKVKCPYLLDLLAPSDWRESGRCDSPPPRLAAPLRKRPNKRKTPMLERAIKAGVEDQLQDVPDDAEPAKRRAIQKANQQIVARAEERLAHAK